MISLDFVLAPPSWILLFVGLVAFAYRRYTLRRTTKAPILSAAHSSEADSLEKCYYQLEPLLDLDVDNEAPVKLRPFKPKYHLTMAVEKTSLSDFIAMDHTYRSRIALRRQLIQDEGENVLSLNPTVEPAVFEFYSWMVRTYLPQRFPTVYNLTPTHLLNHITEERIPLVTASAKEALTILGGNVDCDFLFLLPSLAPKDEGKYRLQGFVTCFPSGFSTLKKLGLKLADIHGPVPGYSEKIEKSMDRFFASLPIGKIVKRANWSITTHTRLFCLAGNHMSEAEKQARQNETDEERRQKEEAMNMDETVLRCERQTLHRLPETKSLVFAFKTYQYPMREIRNEGNGEELAQAIEGLGKGNVPGMRVYKRAVVWGDRVKAFLRGQE